MQNALYTKIKNFALHREYIAKIINAEVKKNKRQWNDFLRDEANKTELFGFLSRKVAFFNYPEGKEVAITSGTEVFTKGCDQQM